MINTKLSHQLIGFPIVGASAGLALNAANNYYSQSLYGSGLNNPFTGDAWDFVLTGASIGGGAALISAGIKFQAQQLKTQRVNDFVSQGLSKNESQLLALIGS